MNNNTNTLSGERLSFYKLFCEKKYRISIPIIQRDYAQGRQTTAEIRKVFLDALYDYLKENKANRDLDFVYGSLNGEDENIEFIPLDGQQRLTTLFLLHWYLCQISDNEKKKAEFLDVLLKNGKSMFTYETRSSSSEFCDELIKNKIDFNNLLEADTNLDGSSKENRLSKTIENSSWFFLSWKYDPTIKSMLTMLDAIHKKFEGKKEYFERLIDTEKPIITFLLLNLKDFKLTDDLYIKMNSRGKPLTTFENFKAKFEQYLENPEKVPSTREFILFGKKEKSLKKYFSAKIDTDWADIFWIYKDIAEGKSNDAKNTYDDELNNFIRVIFANQYAVSVPIVKEKTDNNLEFLLGTEPARKREGYTDKISFYKYEELNALSSEGVFYLIDAFDALKIENEKLKNHLSDGYKPYFDEEEVFKKTLRHELIHRERIMLHAYIRFLIQNKGNTTGLNQWMRVIHNLTYNTIIDSAVLTARAIKSVEKMLPNSGNILTYLKNNDVDGFSSWQILEEKIKAHLITKNDDWKNKIENTEKHVCFDGQIGFILEFSGIVDYYDRDWTEKENKDYFDSFNNYAEKAIAVFKYKDDYNKDFIWERAVLTKGNYLIEASSSRKNLLSTKENARYFSWKRLLQIKDEEDDKKLASKHIFVKQVFDDNLFDKNNIQNSLEKMCKNKTDTWRDYFINCPDLIRYCKQGFIHFNNDKDVILLGQSQMNHKHSEMYTRFLWHKSFEKNKDSFKPFNIQYQESKSSEDDACILLKNFCHNTINYEIRIYYCNDDKLPNPYEIAFRKTGGENIPDKYGNDIKNILKNLSFEWNEEYSGYFFTSKDSDTLMKKLEELNEELLKADNTDNPCS